MIRLTETQQSVVSHDDGAILVVAGPGSGKTRVLTERIRRLLNEDESHFRVLALTFTNKAANEMAERLEGIEGVSERAFIGTMHSFCTEVLANRGKSVGIEGLPNIFDSYQDRKEALQDAVKNIPELRSELASMEKAKDRNRRLDSWLGFIADQKNNLVLPEMVSDKRMGQLYREYNAQLRASNAVDFDDLLLLSYQLFQQRPKVADFYRRQYKYICIDEAQDLNEAQYRVLSALCGKQYANVMMVGDPKQAIFMWNGAHPKYLNLFAKDFDAKQVELAENFRCASTIVAAAKQLDDNYTITGVLPIEGSVAIKELQSEEAEALFIKDEIERLVDHGHADIEGQIKHESFAIIGRSRFALTEIESLFKADDIPFYKKTSGSGAKSESDLVGDFETLLRLMANPLDRLHLGMLLSSWNSSLSIEQCFEGLDIRKLVARELFDKISPSTSDRANPVLKAANAINWAEDRLRLPDAFAVLTEHANGLEDEARALIHEDINEWKKHWDFYVRSQQGGGQSIQGFLSQLALGTTQQPREDGVALLTIHSSKGMEFDVVFVVGMNEGTFPDFRAKGHALLEEQRNAFVAVTRSRRLLYLTRPEMKEMPWGDFKRQQRSRFLSLVENAGL